MEKIVLNLIGSHPKKYNLYKLSEPEEIKIPCNNNIITIYNEGKFILK